MDVYTQPLEAPDDVFVIRQRGREIAEAVGLDNADQVRVATALSEVGRDLLGVTHRGRARFAVDGDGSRLVISLDGYPSEGAADGPGLAAARRLVHDVAVTVGADGTASVVLAHRTSPSHAAVDERGLRSRLVSLHATSPLDELRAQNRQLVATLDEVQAGRDALEQLNAELEETNRGVVAMYTQLSDELETTNRGVVALYAEIDEKSRQLQAASEAKTRFLSQISHELRGPLTSILAIARLLLDDAPAGALGVEGAGSSEPVALIASSATEVLDLVSQLLDLAKAESGRIETELSEVDVSALVRDVVEAAAPVARPGVAVQVVHGDSPLFAFVDAALVRHVVRNLVVNALAFTEVGSIDVEVRMDDDALAILVHDTGIGIAADDLDRIFEEFVQVPGPQQTGRRGTGLGLPYARRVVELMGGSLGVSSAPGEGSTFRVDLPRHRSPGALDRSARGDELTEGDAAIAGDTAELGVP